MYFRKQPDPQGGFIAADNTRFTVFTARRVRSADGINVGYEQFASLADALAAWGLRDSTELWSASDELTPMYSRTYESRE